MGSSLSQCPAGSAKPARACLRRPFARLGELAHEKVGTGFGDAAASTGGRGRQNR
ncbi:hypothetical protein [Streptomyces sp. WMMC940]|uniref:hypothetical protein n=1 Tax=Streptomyces sp. WMMC940 TaxID=3015153 RepID=UPI0022B684A7|nr:hypothetical protein [Streptomyces sp. WMMC940]MCZ7458347.1 hypothetical protein [Streptomyces sp. WMMC940]